jgi:hypothetical protein
MKTAVFLDVAPRSLVNVSEVLTASIIRASVSVYQTTWRSIPEDSHLYNDMYHR